MYPNASLHENIKRLQAFEQAGADVLFAAGSSRPRRCARSLYRSVETREFYGGYQRQIVFLR